MGRVTGVRRAFIFSAASSLLVVAMSVTVAGASSVPAPQRVRATGTATTALVSWSRPPGVPVKNYVVTSRPSGRPCVTRVTKCDVKGLRPGVRYRFTVVARGRAGTSAPSAPSNYVRVATAGAYFSKALSVGSTRISTYETAYQNSATAAKAQPILAKLSGAFIALAKSLSIEQWPSAARSDMSTFVATFRTLGADTVRQLSATTPSGLAGATYTLQSDTNKEVLVEAKVRTELSLAQLIISPIAQTPVPASLGTAQTVHDFYNDPFSVTASQIIDPATAAAGSGLPDAGYRFVAVQLSLANSGAQDISDDANFALTVTGSDGQAYSADFGAVSQCTNFVSGSGYFDLTSGDSTSGCVVFQLPTAVSVQSVSFSLARGYLDTAVWSN